MMKVNRRAITSPICISCSILKITPPTIVVVRIKLPHTDFTISKMVYHTVIVSTMRNGKYAPGIQTSRISLGSMFIMIMAILPHKKIRLKSFGIHFII